MMFLRRFAGCLFVAALAVLAATAPNAVWGQIPIPAEAEEAFNAGEQLFAEEKYDEAIGEYGKAIQLAPEMYAAAHSSRGRSFAAVEDYQNALKDFQIALDISANLPEAYNGRGEVYLNLGSPGEALADFNRAVEADRTNAEYAGNQGQAMAQLGMAQQALKTLDRALERYEASPDLEVPAKLYIAKGQAYATLQDFETAFEEMNRAIEIDPTDHETYYTLGVLQMQAKEHATAVESFIKAAENYTPKQPTDPPYVDPYLGAALAYIETGKEETAEDAKVTAYETAVSQCDMALETALETQQQRSLALFNKGVALRLLGRYGEAIQTFTETTQLSPSFSEAYFRRGIVWHYIGEYGLAIGDFEQATTINFEDVRSYLWLGFSHAANEDYLEAINAYSEALQQNERYAPAYVNRGLAYVQIEDYQKGIDNFNGAIRLEPMEPKHYYRRGASQIMLGDYESAAVSFSIALEFAPDAFEVHRLLAECHENLGNDDLATEARKRAEELEASPETEPILEPSSPTTTE